MTVPATELAPDLPKVAPSADATHNCNVDILPDINIGQSSSANPLGCDPCSHADCNPSTDPCNHVDCDQDPGSTCAKVFDELNIHQSSSVQECIPSTDPCDHLGITPCPPSTDPCDHAGQLGECPPSTDPCDYANCNPDPGRECEKLLAEVGLFGTSSASDCLDRALELATEARSAAGRRYNETWYDVEPVMEELVLTLTKAEKDLQKDSGDTAGQPVAGSRGSDQQRTATTSASGGEWSISVPAESVQAMPAVPAEDQPASLGRVSLDFPDEGETEQDVEYVAGEIAWIRSELPPTDVEKERAVMNCAVATASVIAAAATTPASPAGAIWVATWGTRAVWVCHEMGETLRDEGYMHCEGDPNPKVVWGGSDPHGNRYSSDLSGSLLGDVIDIEAGSSGPGRSESVPVDVGYDGPGYYEGRAECKAELQRGRDRAWRQYQQWGETRSGETEGEATLSVTIRPDNLQAMDGPLRAVGDEVYGIVGEQAFYIGCDASGCPTEVGITATSCGRQILKPGQNEVNYAFVGEPGCIDVTLTVGGDDVTVDVPYMRLDFDTQGGESPV